jgi:hypothetical protein
MDYLRRDSLFSGAGYGHFDWYRLINTLDFHDGPDGQKDIVWPEKAGFAIEEYIFARYYMYQNVYLHKTSRGFEKMVEAMWNRARRLRDDGRDVALMPAIADYWEAKEPTPTQYLAIEEFTVLQQLQRWQDHEDKSLSDLARRMMNRCRFAMIEPPVPEGDFDEDDVDWEEALKETVKSAGYDPPEMYCLKDTLKAKYYQPYFPEKQSDEQSAKNAIRIEISGESEPVEVSELFPRLRPITTETRDQYRYYVPPDVRSAAEKLKKTWRAK